MLVPLYSFGIPQGSQGIQGVKGNTGGDGDGAAAGAAAGTISGAAAGTTSGATAGSTAGLQTAATAYESRISTLETQSTYFLKSAFPPTETCSAILKAKDTGGISTVHNFDQNGL